MTRSSNATSWHTRGFEIATRQANHDWYEVNVALAFAKWIAADEYREAYFESPDDLQLKLADEKLEIAGVRLINIRVVNFIDDPMAEGEPYPGGQRIGGTQAFLCAQRPARFNPGRAKGDSV
jgi:hypothetical protein